MSKAREIDAAIRRGLTFLDKTQEADGGFKSHSSASMRPFRRTGDWQTTFVPALMLASLASLEEPGAYDMRRKLAGFLLKQKDDDWSFNYWAKGSPDRKAQPYPNDLDDTFCALAGLYLHDPDLVDEAALAKIVKLLLSTETAVGGPYRTWLVPADSTPIWLDVDPAVNSNIAYFLSLTGSRLPKLDRMMGQAIVSDKYHSPYYPSVYAFIYYFARVYEGPHKNKLLAKARRMHGKAATDLDRALCISARIRLGEAKDMSRSLDSLLSGQRNDGAWPAATFYADPVKDGKLYYSGAPALTTAFALEALELYIRMSRAPSAIGSGDSALKTGVLALAKRRCHKMPEDLRGTVLGLLDKLAGSDSGAEIIGLPQRFNESLLKPLRPAPKELLETLGLANLYGWAAYTVYDDFLDEEGKPALLPAANAAMRRSLDCFLEALPENQEFGGLVRRVFDGIDGANAWEQTHCRFRAGAGKLAVGPLPDYGDLSKLAERSLGHALPPMAVLAAAGKKVGGTQCREVLIALRHYLIARQLNDDAHDWPDDLRNGHITPVVAILLAELKVTQGAHKASDLLAAARPQFWHHTLPVICRLMNRHVRLSRQALKHSGLVRPGGVMTDLLDGIEKSVEETLAQQRRTKDFLKHYKNKTTRPKVVKQ